MVRHVCDCSSLSRRTGSSDGCQRTGLGSVARGSMGRERRGATRKHRKIVLHPCAQRFDCGARPVVTGATLFVVDPGVDTGPIVAQRAVEVAPDDTVESLHERIKVAERGMLVDSIGAMAREGFVVEGRRVRIGRLDPLD